MVNWDLIEKIKKSIYILKYMNAKEKEEFLSDKQNILEIIKNNINTLKYIDSSKNDKEIILEAVKCNANAIYFANDFLLNDEDIIIEAIKQKPDFYELAGKKLKKNKEYTKKALKINKEIYKYIDNSIKDDIEILKLINFDKDLISLYGKIENESSQIKVLCENKIFDRGIFFGINIMDSRINEDITIKDFINKYLAYCIDGIYEIIGRNGTDIIDIGLINANKGRNKIIDLKIKNQKIKDIFTNDYRAIECYSLQNGLDIKIDPNAYLKLDDIRALTYEDIFFDKIGKNIFYFSEINEYQNANFFNCNKLNEIINWFKTNNKKIYLILMDELKYREKVFM